LRLAGFLPLGYVHYPNATFTALRRSPIIAKPTSVERENETYAASLGNALQTAGPLLVEEDGFDPEIRARLVEAAEKAQKMSSANRFSRGLRRLAAAIV